MIDRRRIIDKYRNASFEDRLYLFLDHRYLRDQFSRIDSLESQSPAKPIFAGDPKVKKGL
jgi:hypothetical protein